eukprot:COSAG02_NODE_34689_length_480_cov_0.750656_1_plen_65_part_10
MRDELSAHKDQRVRSDESPVSTEISQLNSVGHSGEELQSTRSSDEANSDGGEISVDSVHTSNGMA